MFIATNSQTSFYDADYVCERLISKDSFYRKFKEVVAPLIDDGQFESMYCKDNGRPPISPALLAMATILQFYRSRMKGSGLNTVQIAFPLLNWVENPCRQRRPYGPTITHRISRRFLSCNISRQRTERHI